MSETFDSIIDGLQSWWRQRHLHHRMPDNLRSREAIAAAERERALLPEPVGELEGWPLPACPERPVAPPYESMPGKAVFVHRTDGRWFTRVQHAGDRDV